MNIIPTSSVFGLDRPKPAKCSELQPGLVELTGFQTLHVSGDDASSFLQGQFTNHVLDLAVGECQLTGYCNPKGRALAVIWLLRTETGYSLIIPVSLADKLVKRLTMFKMRARVTLEVNGSDQYLGVIDPSGGYLNLEHRNCVWKIDKYRAFVARSGEAGEILTGENDGDIVLFDHDYWQLAQILSGEPMIYEATYEALIPQHMNLDLVEGVSFTKGCYPGQEIVARLRYLGKLKQRMIIGYCEVNGEIGPGTPVFTEEKGEQKAGVIIDAVQLGDRYALSVNVPATHIEAGNVAIGTPSGALLERCSLPYRITLEKND